VSSTGLLTLRVYGLSSEQMLLMMMMMMIMLMAMMIVMMTIVTCRRWCNYGTTDMPVDIVM